MPPLHLGPHLLRDPLAVLSYSLPFRGSRLRPGGSCLIFHLLGSTSAWHSVFQQITVPSFLFPPPLREVQCHRVTFSLCTSSLCSRSSPLITSQGSSVCPGCFVESGPSHFPLHSCPAMSRVIFYWLCTCGLSRCAVRHLSFTPLGIGLLHSGQDTFALSFLWPLGSLRHSLPHCAHSPHLGHHPGPRHQGPQISLSCPYL